jgi:hypothetical protein
MRNDHWMITYTGKRFWPMDPRSEDVCIDDIAHALSNICRFGGHCRQFYSVAQHSVLVSRTVAKGNELLGLLHDAPEAYCGDMVRPLKKHSEISTIYREMEGKIWLAVASKFGLPINSTEWENVKWADDTVLLTEKRDLVVPHDFVWTDVHIANGGKGLQPLVRHINPVGPDMAKTMFVNRFLEITNGK